MEQVSAPGAGAPVTATAPPARRPPRHARARPHPPAPPAVGPEQSHGWQTKGGACPCGRGRRAGGARGRAGWARSSPGQGHAARAGPAARCRAMRHCGHAPATPAVVVAVTRCGRLGRVRAGSAPNVGWQRDGGAPPQLIFAGAALRARLWPATAPFLLCLLGFCWCGPACRLFFFVQERERKLPLFSFFTPFLFFYLSLSLSLSLVPIFLLCSWPVVCGFAYRGCVLRDRPCHARTR